MAGQATYGGSFWVIMSGETLTYECGWGASDYYDVIPGHVVPEGYLAVESKSYWGVLSATASPNRKVRITVTNNSSSNVFFDFSHFKI